MSKQSEIWTFGSFQFPFMDQPIIGIDTREMSGLLD